MQKRDWLKYSLGFTVVLFIRLLPFRPPNVEPLLATQMPFAKKYGGLAGFFFAFFSIIVYDLLTAGIGVWTLIAGMAYGLLGMWASIYFKNKKGTSWDYAKFAFIGTIVFDITTGLSLGPIFFNQPFIQAVTGQIPFTLLHLVGNIGFALTLSPLVQYMLSKQEKKQTSLATNLSLSPNQI